MNDLFELVTGLLDVASTSHEMMNVRGSISDLNQKFCRSFIQKYDLSTKTKDETFKIISAHQAELYNYGVSIQEAYLFIYLGSVGTLLEIEEMKKTLQSDAQNDYKKFKEAISDLTET